MRKGILALVLVSLVGIALFFTNAEARAKRHMTAHIVNMARLEEAGYTAVIWEERTYVPYCVIEKKDCGEQIGIVNGDGNDKIYEYRGHSTEEWIVNLYTSGLMDNAMLCREVSVTEIPEGLESEYEWNH